MTPTTRNLAAVTALASALIAAAAACTDDSMVTVTTPDAGTPDASRPVDDGGPQTDAGTDGATASSRVVYVNANIITSNQNAVLAYAQAADGSLSPLAGSPFLTNGTGVSNPTQGLGPDDGDKQIVISSDKKHLFAVNAGSDTIAVFDVHDDGSLSAVAGSPFASGGVNPISIGLAGDYAFVVNQAQDPARPSTGTPSYVGLPLAPTGVLGAPATTVAAGKSPQLALVTPDAKLLFGLDFMAPLASGAGPLRSFVIGSGGTLTAAAGTPMALPYVDGGMPPGTPLALGLALHPTQKILYVGFVVRKQVGVYTYDANGVLTYVTNTSVTGPAPCWIRMNQAGDRAYVADTGTNSVSVLDTSTPLAPTEVQNLVLADKGPNYDAGGMGSPTSEAYEEELSPDGNYLYVLSQNTNPDLTAAGNVLHVLSVGTDGHVAETVADVKLSLGTGVRPQGIAVR